MICPDYHAPWSDIDKICEFYAAVEREKPTHIIQIGDAADFLAHSKFARSHDECTPKEEVGEAIEFIKNFWISCKKLAKKAECIQLLGNHENRLSRRIYERYPEIASLVDQKSLFTFQGVTTIHDAREWVEINDVIYCHGFFSKLGDHVKYFQKSVVRGHSHRAGVVFFNQYKKILFEMECGYLADPNSVAMSYTSTKRTNWVHGYGLVDSHGPRFIPIV